MSVGEVVSMRTYEQDGDAYAGIVVRLSEDGSLHLVTAKVLDYQPVVKIDQPA